MSAAAKASSDALLSVPEPPSDSISSLCFGRESDFLAVSSWDSRLRVYDGGAGGLLWSAEDTDPLLSCAFGGTDDAIFAAGLSGSILQFDPTSTAEATRLGSHSAPVSCLCYDAYVTNTLLSGGWDGRLRQWDSRVPGYLVATASLGAGAAAQGRSSAASPSVSDTTSPATAAAAAAAAAAAVAPAPTTARAVALDVSGRHVVVACGARAIEMFDLRRLDRFIQARESSLAAQTRALKCSPDGERFVVAGLEGRVAVEFIDPSPEAQVRLRVFVVTLCSFCLLRLPISSLSLPYPTFPYLPTHSLASTPSSAPSSPSATAPASSTASTPSPFTQSHTPSLLAHSQEPSACGMRPLRRGSPPFRRSGTTFNVTLFIPVLFFPLF